MAGAGTRLFVAGEVLTAAQVNTFLQDQVIMRFADSAARDVAFGGVGEPVLAEGMFCYLLDTNEFLVYTGSWTAVDTSSRCKQNSSIHSNYGRRFNSWYR
jgi:hypothetical protein